MGSTEISGLVKSWAFSPVGQFEILGNVKIENFVFISRGTTNDSNGDKRG